MEPTPQEIGSGDVVFGLEPDEKVDDFADWRFVLEALKW